ncbi:MAG: HlyD family secretion protein [Sphingobium sp.]
MAEADRNIVDRIKPMDGVSAKISQIAPPVPTEKKQRKLLFFSLPVLIALGSGAYWLLSGNTVSTDNAYVRQDIVSVSSDVIGKIVAVNVKENQQVKAGDVLFRIDDAPYRVALAQADSQVAQAQVAVKELQTDYAGTGVDIAKARSDIGFAQTDYDRQRALSQKGFTTKVRLDETKHALDLAKAQLQTALSDAAKSRSALATGAQVPGVNPRLAAALAQREKALLDLLRTVIRAPIAGRVSSTNRLQIGQMEVTGVPALALVANERSWVDANFKETDLDELQPGQPVKIKFDAYPDEKLKGHVESIGGGTGSQFSVLPAQNASGNWVKITQRVPIRIAIDQHSNRQLVAGLSAQVTVDVSK